MSTTKKISDKHSIKVTIDPSLDKYKDKTLFPEKLARANEEIKNSNLVEFLAKLEAESKGE